MSAFALTGARVSTEVYVLKQILFVCTGNTCRSPMAEAFFNDLAPREGLAWRAISAGTGVVSDRASDGAKGAVQEYGVDLSNHETRRVSDELIAKADLILTMTQNHKVAIQISFPSSSNKVFTLLQFAGKYGDIKDPFLKSPEVYGDCAREIYTNLEAIIDRLK